MKKILLPAFFAIAFCGLASTAQAQYKIGDKVEANDYGVWRNAVIVSERSAKPSGTGYTYQVHYDRDDDHADHRFDIALDENFIRPRSGQNSTRANSTAANDRSSTAKANSANAVLNRTVNRRSPSAKWTNRKFDVGDRVLYSNGYKLWSGPGVITEINHEKRRYNVRDIADPSTRYDYPCYAVIRPGEFDNDFYIGKWDVHIIGATSTFTHMGKKYRQYSGGMSMPPLEIRPDGTYTWRLSAREVIHGRWQEREEYPGIVLLKAIDGENYTIYERTEAFGTDSTTRDEIGITHLESGTGYFAANRLGANQSCVLVNRQF